MPLGRAATAAGRAASRKSYRKVLENNGGRLTEHRKAQNRKSFDAYKKNHKERDRLEKAANRRRARAAACAGLQGKHYNFRELDAAPGQHTDSLYQFEDESGEPSVIKVLKVDGKKPKGVNDASTVKAEQEAALLRAAGHKRVACGSGANIVIPLVEHSLFDWAVTDGRCLGAPVMPVDAARGVRTALEALHAQGCSHGDLDASATGDHFRFFPTMDNGKRSHRVVLIDFDKGSLEATEAQRVKDRQQAAAGLLRVLEHVPSKGDLDNKIERRIRTLKARKRGSGSSCTLEEIVEALGSI